MTLMKDKMDACVSWATCILGITVSMQDVTSFFNMLLAIFSAILVGWRIYKDIWLSIFPKKK